jgi:hypothetical protein
MGADKDPDELIRLIQRQKRAEPKQTPVAKARSTPPKVPPHDGALSPFMQGMMQALLGSDVPVFDNAGVHGSIIAAAQGHAAPVPSPPLTEAEVLTEIERRQKIARVRFMVRHWENETFSSEYARDVPCSKILWKIRVRGDLEREVVQSCAGFEAEVPVPWTPGSMRVRLGAYPCFIFGFKFVGPQEEVHVVNWPHGFTKG